MNRSQKPFLIGLAAILLILVLINELGRKPAGEPAPRSSVKREYSNPTLGFAFKLPEGWTYSDSLASERKALRAILQIEQLPGRGIVWLRASMTPWEYFEPLAETRIEQRESAVVAGRQGWSAPASRGRTYISCEGPGVILELLGPKTLVDSVIAGLWWPSDEDRAQGELSVTRPSALPEHVKRWRQECQALDVSAFGSVLQDQGKTYVYVGSGQRPTGGYACTISSILRAGNERIAVFADFSRPRLGELVTQAYSYPNDLVLIDGTGYAAQFFGDGDDAPPFIARLAGIDSLRSIFDQSRSIKIFSPPPGAMIDGAVAVSGVVHGTVERLFSRLLDSAETVISEKSRTPGTSPDWHAFADTLVFSPLRSGSVIYLECYSIDDPSGDIVDQIRVPLRIKKR